MTGQSAKAAVAPRSVAKAERSAARRRKLKAEPSVRILETRVYRGPNYWNYEPAIKLLVDLGVLEDFPSNTIPGFVDGPKAARSARRTSFSNSAM